MSRQLCQRYATAYSQQINPAISIEALQCASIIMCWAMPHIIFLWYIRRHQKAIPSHDHDPDRIMDTSNRAMILPMLCRRWDKRSTGAHNIIMTSAHVDENKTEESTQTIQMKCNNQQPSDTGLRYMSEKKKSHYVACLRIHPIEFFWIGCKNIQREEGMMSLLNFTQGEWLVTS